MPAGQRDSAREVRAKRNNIVSIISPWDAFKPRATIVHISESSGGAACSREDKRMKQSREDVEREEEGGEGDREK